MSQKNYSELLSNRMEQDFAKWENQKEIQEREVYRFLHTMKGTAGTVGLPALSDFCSMQLPLYDEKSSDLLTIESLQDFMKTARSFFEQDNNHTETTSLVPAPQEVVSSKNFVLVIESDAELASSVKEILEKNGIQVVIALDGKKGLEFFYTLHPQMVIVDLNLPDMDGFKLVSKIHDTA